MEAKTFTFPQRTPEEIKEWFHRRKARQAAREQEIKAMYDHDTQMFNSMKP